MFFPRVEEFDIVLKKTADDKYLKPGLALPATELVALKKVRPNSVSEKRSNKLQERK